MDTKPLSESLYPVPLSVEGFFVLHQMLRFRWAEWRKLDSVVRKQIAEEARTFFADAELRSHGQSALFSMLGHKGDVLLIHFRESLDQLKVAELKVGSLKLSDYLEPQTSFVSVVELGLYESSVKIFRALAEKGVARSEERRVGKECRSRWS